MTTKAQNKGFTLVEILVVIVIISIVSTAALLVLSSSQHSRLKLVSQQLVNRLRFAEDTSILLPSVIKFELSQDGYEFFQFNDDEKKWDPLRDANLRPESLASSINLVLENPTIVKDDTPHIIFSSSGTITPFTLRVGADKKKSTFVITGLANGEISVKENF